LPPDKKGKVGELPLDGTQLDSSPGGKTSRTDGNRQVRDMQRDDVTY